MTPAIVLLKIFVTILTVVGLSVVAEHVSPRVAGVLSGYPLGAAIALFFIGLEMGPAFAAQSAVYTMAGLVGSLVFVYLYHLTAARVRGHGVLAASAVATAGYFGAIALLRGVAMGRAAAVALPVLAAVGVAYLLRRIENVKIGSAIRLTFRVLLFRAAFAAAIILAITGAARAVGPRWAGLFSAFPTTLFPLLLIVHLTYGRVYVDTILRNFPRGLGSLILYALSVSVVYPRFGVSLGTVVSLAVATAYLIAYGAVVARRGA